MTIEDIEWLTCEHANLMQCHFFKSAQTTTWLWNSSVCLEGSTWQSSSDKLLLSFVIQSCMDIFCIHITLSAVKSTWTISFILSDAASWVRPSYSLRLWNFYHLNSPQNISKGIKPIYHREVGVDLSLVHSRWEKLLV